MVQDVKSIFSFINTSLNSHLAPKNVQVDPSRLIVAGASAGGYLARLAALYAEPRPRALLSSYGMGGQYLGTAFTAGGDDPFKVGLPPLDPSDYEDFTDLGRAKGKEEVSSVPMQMEPDMATDSGRRSELMRVLLQTGKYLDVLTGIEGFSSRLVENGLDNPTIPEEAKPLFPELSHHSFPPTYLIHGAKDTVILPQE
jgi:acetyl esterase/lipase